MRGKHSIAYERAGLTATTTARVPSARNRRHYYFIPRTIRAICAVSDYTSVLRGGAETSQSEHPATVRETPHDIVIESGLGNPTKMQIFDRTHNKLVRYFRDPRRG